MWHSLTISVRVICRGSGYSSLRSPSLAYSCFFFLVTVGEKAGLGHGCRQKTGSSLALIPFPGNLGEGSDKAGLCCWVPVQHTWREADHPSLQQQCSGQDGGGDVVAGDCWLLHKRMLPWAVAFFAAWRKLQSHTNLSELIIVNQLSQFTCSCCVWCQQHLIPCSL